MAGAAPQRFNSREMAQFLQARTPLRPNVAMLLGSGHASIANQLKEKVVLHGVTGKAGLASLRHGDVDFAVGPMLDTPPDIVSKTL